MLAYALSNDTAITRALCVVVQSRLSSKRVMEEMDRFRAVVRPDLAHRIELLTMSEDDSPEASRYDSDPAFLEWLAALVAKEASAAPAGRSNQQSVSSLLVQAWLRDEGPQTFKALQNASGASYPTVAAAVRDLREQGFIEDQSDKRVLLKYLTHDAWLKIGRAHAENRKVLRFSDPTGQSRTPEAMAQRLAGLQKKGLAGNVAVGGVLGAMHYFPDLDITASPRLDLTVYGDGIDFVPKLDAALEQTSAPQANAVLVVHLTQATPRFIERGPDITWASELDCFADLIEMGLTQAAGDMVADFNHRRNHGNAGLTT